ncbi:hypothetical protein BKP45_00580 [Anaerobacillus alkalidiazotrophicus]|uniref:YtxH domain-containing protein n=1 Tax=Anaerobacillus alkalidiazotrophicus TaxID=472963 RepID=A0A1S2M950_9BACI|nr:hypothetical protein [Anaerobacillus alkalidiazotrophicus]OIJ21312.1 hypothetical protein BKP45_00580 [Anaerobacillus alkalidiazotrophicus]
MDEDKKKQLVRTMIIGGIVGSIVMATKSKKNVCSCLKTCTKKTSTFINFINENRSEILDHIKNTSNKLTKAIDDTNHDIKAITENIKHLRNSSLQVVTAVKETKGELMSLYEDCNQNQKPKSNITTENLEEKKDV